MSIDIHVPDQIFEGQVKKNKNPESALDEKFIVPLKTFWRPVNLAEFVETNLDDPRYRKVVNPLTSLKKENFGQFLAPELRSTLLATKMDKMESLQRGQTVSGLRAVVPNKVPEYIAFDKFTSRGELKQTKELDHQKEIIKFKTTKKTYEADIPFKFE